MVVAVLRVTIGESMVDVEMAAMLQKKKKLVRDYSSDTIKRIQETVIIVLITRHTYLCTYFISLYNPKP
jgi:hypothetical protein